LALRLRRTHKFQGRKNTLGWNVEGVLKTLLKERENKNQEENLRTRLLYFSTQLTFENKLLKIYITLNFNRKYFIEAELNTYCLASYGLIHYLNKLGVSLMVVIII